MKWILAAGLVATGTVLYVLARRDAPRVQDGPEPAPVSSGDVAPSDAPTLIAGSSRQAASATTDEGEPAFGKTDEGESAADTPIGELPGAALSPPPPDVAAERAKVEQAAKKKIAARPGFTPVTALERPTAEERKAATAATLKKLEATRPLRVTWNDAPLQDVLRQLSAQTGLVIALGPGSIERGAKIRVRNPLADADPTVEPNVLHLIEALAKKHDLEANPWKKGVLLHAKPDPTRIGLRYFDAKDLLAAPWGADEKIDPAYRLAAVFADLIREAAGLEPDSSVEIHNGIVIARQTHAALRRVDEAFGAWRTDPERLQRDYRALIAKRHPTVSGAPPR